MPVRIVENGGDPVRLVEHGGDPVRISVHGPSDPVRIKKGWNKYFDQGSAESIDASDPANIRIVPCKTWNNNWAWYSIKNNSFAGQSPTFYIAKANHYNMVAGEWLACWATEADTDTWTQMDNVTIGAIDLTFDKVVPFPSGTIYISALPMYPFSRIQRKITAWALNALVGETTSTTDKIIMNMTPRAAPLGGIQTAPALPLYGLKVANATVNTKNKVVLTAYNHPSETPGPFALEGAMDWLLTAGSKQKFLLDWCEFYVYPCQNPQGVYCGYFRSCPQGPTYDHNRKWYDGTSGVIEEIDALKNAIATDCTDVDVAFDYHSYMSNSAAFGNVIDNTDAPHVAYKAKMVAYDAAFVLSNSAVVDGFKDYIAATYGSTLQIAFEHGLTTTKGVADWKTYGAQTMQALCDFLAEGRLPGGPGVGSRDFNAAAFNRIDWAAVADLTGSPITISAWVYSDWAAGFNYILDIHRLGDAANGIVLYQTSAVDFFLSRNGATILSRGMFAGASVVGAWHHILATHNGTFNDFTTIHIRNR